MRKDMKTVCLATAGVAAVQRLVTCCQIAPWSFVSTA